MKVTCSSGSSGRTRTWGRDGNGGRHDRAPPDIRESVDEIAGLGLILVGLSGILAGVALNAGAANRNRITDLVETPLSGSAHTVLERIDRVV